MWKRSDLIYLSILINEWYILCLSLVFSISVSYFSCSIFSFSGLRTLVMDFGRFVFLLPHHVHIEWVLKFIIRPLFRHTQSLSLSSPLSLSLSLSSPLSLSSLPPCLSLPFSRLQPSFNVTYRVVQWHSDPRPILLGSVVEARHSEEVCGCIYLFVCCCVLCIPQYQLYSMLVLNKNSIVVLKLFIAISFFSFSFYPPFCCCCCSQRKSPFLRDTQHSVKEIKIIVSFQLIILKIINLNIIFIYLLWNDSSILLQPVGCF